VIVIVALLCLITLVGAYMSGGVLGVIAVLVSWIIFAKLWETCDNVAKVARTQTELLELAKRFHAEQIERLDQQGEEEPTTIATFRRQPPANSKLAPAADPAFDAAIAADLADGRGSKTPPPRPRPLR
jgi:hypothetical protein